MRKFLRASFSFKEAQLLQLQKLSELTKVPKSVYVREAIDRLLKRYHYLTTMTKHYSPEEALYLATVIGGVEVEDMRKDEVELPRRKRKSEKLLSK